MLDRLLFTLLPGLQKGAPAERAKKRPRGVKRPDLHPAAHKLPLRRVKHLHKKSKGFLPVCKGNLAISALSWLTRTFSPFKLR